MKPIYKPSNNIAICMDIGNAISGMNKHLFDDRYVSKKLYAILLVKAYLHYVLNANRDRTTTYIHIIEQAHDLVFRHGLDNSPMDLVDNIQVYNEGQAYGMVAEVFASKVMRIFDTFQTTLKNWFERHPVNATDHVEVLDANIKDHMLIIHYIHEPKYVSYQHSYR